MTTLIEGPDAAAGTSTIYTIGMGDFVHGTMTSGADHDWYSISLDAGQQYTFALAGIGLHPDHVENPFLILRNSSGAEIAADNDAGPGGASSITFTAPTTGTYYLDVGSFLDLNSGQYALSAITGPKANYDADMAARALLHLESSWSPLGTPATVTYSFRETTPVFVPNFSQFSAEQIVAAEAELQILAEIANLTFVRVAPGGYSDLGQITFGNYSNPNPSESAFALPPGNPWEGDVWINIAQNSTTNVGAGTDEFRRLFHETSHALGILHPGDYNGSGNTYEANAQFIQDSRQYTVMSYFFQDNTGAIFNGEYSRTPMLFDIYALQMQYGANMSTRTGDTVYGFNTNAGDLYRFITGFTAPVYTIWDAGGSDTIDASGYSQSQIISLNAGTFSDIGGSGFNISIAFGATIENAIGGSGNDTIYGNGVSNVLIGGLGSDTIYGGEGADTLRGGAGYSIVDTLNGDGGFDTMSFSDVGPVSFGVGVTVVLGANGNGTLLASSGAGADIYTSIEGLEGSNSGDQLTGNAQANLLAGLNGNDRLTGEGENDTLLGQVGDDILNGGAGNDLLYGGDWFGDSGTRDIMSFARPSSPLNTGVSFTLAPGGSGTACPAPVIRGQA